jgi:hypothetical protein
LRYVQLGFVAAVLLCCVAVRAQERQPAAVVSKKSSEKPSTKLDPEHDGRLARLFKSYGVPEDRWLFPRHWIRGYTEFEGAPPTNEPDLGRCAQVSASQFGGVNDPCAAFARYMLGGYLEVQPVGRTALRHVFVFYIPRLSFGHTVPQFSYTASFQPIAYDRSVGLGIELPKHFELRLTQHQVDWLGTYRHDLGPADLHTTGPYGLYTTIGMRWYFGGYGRVTGGP